MKILTKIMPLMAVLALSTSCKKEYITEEYGSQIKTYYYDVKPSDWHVENSVDNRNYWYADFDNFDINDRVLDHGMVTGSVLYTYNVEDGSQSWNNMPYVYPFTTKNNEIVAENIRFEYENGRVTFVIEDLDGITPDDMLDPITFKVNVATNMR